MPKALIVGVPGPDLDSATRRLLTDIDPLGFILFARNVENPAQVRALVADLRNTIGRADAPVLIDQEGGRVARLKPPHWRAAPPASVFGRLAARNPEGAKRAVHLNAQLIGAELAALGINVDCAPVCDVPAADADPIIGDRAFATDPETVAVLARCFCAGLSAAGVLPVIKHIPGHGRAMADSHQEMPHVDAPHTELDAIDFAPFRALADCAWGMTAHVVYSHIDPDHPATMSATVINETIRRDLGFNGFLVSDDVSMGALTGPMGERVRACMSAGCDAVLHCNGDMAEMMEVADNLGSLTDIAEIRFDKTLTAKQTPEPLDRREAEGRLEALLNLVRESA